MCGETEHSMDENLIPSVNAEQRGEQDNHVDHPVSDFVFCLGDYFVQLLSVWFASPLVIAASGNAGEISATVYVLLVTTVLLAAENAADVYYSGALAAPHESLLHKAFLPLLGVAVANTVLFVLLACLNASTVFFFVAWFICAASSLIGPNYLIRYRFERCRFGGKGHTKQEGRHLTS